MNILELDHITIKRGQIKTTDKLSLSFVGGLIYVVLGPNGVGKSSLLKAIFGEVAIADGDIRYDERKLQQHSLSIWRKPIGYMPQDTQIEASLSALDVVLLGKLDALHMYLGDDDLSQALKVMERLGIVHLAQRDMLSLSGGQRQMVLFAQVLLRNPKILLLDEPVSALDMHHQMVLLDHVANETRRLGLVTIMVLHDLNLAAQYADRLVLLGNGSLAVEGTAEKVLDPALIAKLYNVEVERLYDSEGKPIIRPKSRRPIS